MDGLLAMVSAICIFISALIILDAISRRQHLVLAFFSATTVFSGVICYISLDALPDPQGLPRYLKAAVPVGVFLFSIIGILVASSPNRKRK
jgi:FtsH-binding integral membrane protein